MTKIFIAYDKMDLKTALALQERLGKTVGAKLNDLIAKWCQPLVECFRDAGAVEFFVDVKTLDTEDTVAETAKAWHENGATVMTVHACGGREMIAAAKKSGIKVYAVTVLTSFDDARCMRIFNRPLNEQVRITALEAAAGGADGIICSAKEVGWLSKMPELAHMEKVVPGTRSIGANMHDQKRSATAAEAVADGATGLVLGREVTQDPAPADKLAEIRGTLAA